MSISFNFFHISSAFSSTFAKSSTHKSFLKCFEAVAMSIDTLVWWKNLEASIENVQRSDRFSLTSSSSIVPEVILEILDSYGIFFNKSLRVFHTLCQIIFFAVQLLGLNWYFLS